DFLEVFGGRLLHFQLHGAVARIEIIENPFSGFASVRFTPRIERFGDALRKLRSRSGKPQGIQSCELERFARRLGRCSLQKVAPQKDQRAEVEVIPDAPQLIMCQRMYDIPSLL